MNREEIKRVLPHREPMLLLDEAELVGDEASPSPVRSSFSRGTFPATPWCRA